MELSEAHWRGQNAAAQGRTVKGQDRGAVGQHQERAPTRPVILPSTNCRLYYRLVSNFRRPSPAGRIFPELEGWALGPSLNGGHVCGVLAAFRRHTYSEFFPYGGSHAKRLISYVIDLVGVPNRIRTGVAAVQPGN